jgi:hypothetical protein
VAPRHGSLSGSCQHQKSANSLLSAILTSHLVSLQEVVLDRLLGIQQYKRELEPPLLTKEQCDGCRRLKNALQREQLKMEADWAARTSCRRPAAAAAARQAQMQRNWDW